jgi:hypothetical protein
MVIPVSLQLYSSRELLALFLVTYFNSEFIFFIPRTEALLHTSIMKEVFRRRHTGQFSGKFEEFYGPCKPRDGKGFQNFQISGNFFQ